MPDLLDTLLAITPGPLLMLDAGGKMTHANAPFQRLTGRDAAALTGMSFVSLLRKDDRPQAARLIAEAGGPGRMAELRIDQGEAEPSHVVFTAARAGADGGVLLAGADVTEQRRLESQAVQARKGESLARLTRGMAHDFNNALAVVMSYAELILMDTEPGDPRRADVETIREAAVRAGELTRQILVFSRPQTVQPRSIDLNTLVIGLDKMLRRLIGTDVELVTLLGENLEAAEGDLGQIESAIVSAVVTAREALEAGGTITIQTGLATSNRLSLSVSHSGGGDPVMIALPRARESEPPAVHVPLTGTETIILADDNEMVRRSISALLRKRGFTVLTASNGEEAIHLARSHEGTVDLVLADVVMPKMTALELDTRIREARPGARIVFMSGYADDAVSRGAVKPAGFIQKPFTADALARKIREVLGAGPPPTRP